MSRARGIADPRVPPPLRPLVRAYGEVGAAGLHGGLLFLDRTCRFSIQGDLLLGSPSARIYCAWHEHGITSLVLLIRRCPRGVSLCHPVWQTSPWVALGPRAGWEVILGSSGHGGRDAARQITERLRAGLSTTVLPDGPRGPPYVPRRGALVMALEAGVPIIPLHFRYSAALTLPKWDRMRIPLPGSTIYVDAAPPMHVTPASIDADLSRLAEALHGRSA